MFPNNNMIHMCENGENAGSYYSGVKSQNSLVFKERIECWVCNLSHGLD